jgi:glutamyl-tRNA synthetase
MGLSDDGRDVRPLIDSVKARSRTILQIADRVAVRLDPSRSGLDEKGAALIRKMGPTLSSVQELAADALEPLRNGSWSAERLLASLKEMAASNGLKLGDAMQPIRVALTGSTVSEPVNELLEVVGPERSLARMREVAGRERGPGPDG